MLQSEYMNHISHPISFDLIETSLICNLRNIQGYILFKILLSGGGGNGHWGKNLNEDLGKKN